MSASRSGPSRHSGGVIAGQHVLEGVATGTTHGTVTDVSETKRLVSSTAVVAPDLGQNLFSVAASSNMLVMTLFDFVQPQLVMGSGSVVLPMQRLGSDEVLCSFSLEIDGDFRAAALSAESADL